MEIKQVFRILGCKGFKGEVEGTNYDSTTLNVEMPVSERSGNERGHDVQKIKFGKSDEYEKMKGLKFPLEAELQLALTTKGYECYGFRAVTPGTAKAA